MDDGEVIAVIHDPDQLLAELVAMVPPGAGDDWRFARLDERDDRLSQFANSI